VLVHELCIRAPSCRKIAQGEEKSGRKQRNLVSPRLLYGFIGQLASARLGVTEMLNEIDILKESLLVHTFPQSPVGSILF